MSPALNSDGSFAMRPPIGALFRAPGGETVTIAASWQCGVVFEGGICCTARDLLDHFTPLQKELCHVSSV